MQTLLIDRSMISRYPTQARSNEINFQKLMEFLSTLKEGANPKRQLLELTFFLRTPVEGEFDEGSIVIRTSGGRCHKMVGETLGEFFKCK
jgi:hypothetical protein